MADEREAELLSELMRIHARLAEMAEEESRSAPGSGLATRGERMAEKERLLDEADRLIAELRQRP